MVSRMVFGRGLKQISVGLGAGVLMAVGAAAGLRSMFLGFGQTGSHALIYLGVLSVLGSVAGAALLIPARRAAKVNPMVALRSE